MKLPIVWLARNWILQLFNPIKMTNFDMTHPYPPRNLFQRLIKPRFYGIDPRFTQIAPFVCTLPERFEAGEGQVIYEGRNVLRQMEYEGLQLVVKSFTRPYIVNRLAYGTVRGSKAKRSFLYAQAFQKIGVGTPTPVAWLDQRNGLLLDKSYYVSLLSACPYRYEVFFEQSFPCMEKVLRAIGRQTALLHEHGYAHKDYGRGNILFNFFPDGTVQLEVVDLNRMHIGRIGLKEGCKNFCRLPATEQMHRWMAEEYAKARGFDVETCYQLIMTYRHADKGPEEY